LLNEINRVGVENERLVVGEEEKEKREKVERRVDFGV
jgi:hypothetical protein